MNPAAGMAALGPLATARLNLRALEPDDAPFILGHFSDPQVCRYLVDAEPFQSLEEAQGLIRFFMAFEQTNAYRWGICLGPGGPLIGTIGFLHWDRRNNSAEIGFDLAPAFWGQGLVREALLAVIESGFEHLGLNRLWAVVHPDNRRCLATLARLGFVSEGVARDMFYFRGQYYDHCILSLLRRQWPPQTPAGEGRQA